MSLKEARTEAYHVFIACEDSPFSVNEAIISL